MAKNKLCYAYGSFIKYWSAPKKFKQFLIDNWVGGAIGLAYATIGITGIFVCNWNSIEGSVVPSGICSNSLLAALYIPAMKLVWPFALLGEMIFGSLKYSLLIESIVLIIISTLGGATLQAAIKRR